VTGGVRPPAAAGSFYPDDPTELGETVDRLLRAADEVAATGRAWPWGIVAPHAGYRYSGSVAATAYAAVRPWASELHRVLLLGPAHFVPLEGCAVPAADAWRTPLGDVGIAEELRSAALGAGCRIGDDPHAPEHALEVQLPFLQRLAGESPEILPVAVGVSSPGEVAGLLARVPADLVVVSTDLSHYLDIEAARAVDRRTVDAVVARDADAIGDACGVFALRGAVAFARETGRPIRLLDLRTSGDTAGDPHRVVGYGAFAIG
jgi:hypothetical protein